MSFHNIAQYGDVVKPAVGNSDESSYQEQYARFQLLEAKLKASGRDSDIGEVLGKMSELEEINIQVLKEISQYKESTPEFAQLYNMTGTKDRFKQAMWLAEKIYEQVRSEAIMSFYTPDKNEIKEAFYKSTSDGLKARAGKVSIGTAKVASKKSAASTLLSSATSRLTS